MKHNNKDKKQKPVRCYIYVTELTTLQLDCICESETCDTHIGLWIIHASQEKGVAGEVRLMGWRDLRVEVSGSVGGGACRVTHLQGSIGGLLKWQNTSWWVNKDACMYMNRI